MAVPVNSTCIWCVTTTLPTTLPRSRHGWLGIPCFHVYFTPTGSSWMNQVERWFGLLTDKFIRRGVHALAEAPEKAIAAHMHVMHCRR